MTPEQWDLAPWYAFVFFSLLAGVCSDHAGQRRSDYVGAFAIASAVDLHYTVLPTVILWWMVDTLVRWVRS